jgi:hypothetical protein
MERRRKLRTLWSMTHRPEYSRLGTFGALLGGLCRIRCGAVEVAVKAGAGKSGHGEPLPHEFVGVEENGDGGGCREADRVEALGTETIAPDGKASARAEVEDISWRHGGDLAVAREGSRGGGADGLRGSAKDP